MFLYNSGRAPASRDRMSGDDRSLQMDPRWSDDSVRDCCCLQPGVLRSGSPAGGERNLHAVHIRDAGMPGSDRHNEVDIARVVTESDLAFSERAQGRALAGSVRSRLPVQVVSFSGEHAFLDGDLGIRGVLADDRPDGRDVQGQCSGVVGMAEDRRLVNHVTEDQGVSGGDGNASTTYRAFHESWGGRVSRMADPTAVATPATSAKPTTTDTSGQRRRRTAAGTGCGSAARSITRSAWAGTDTMQ